MSLSLIWHPKVQFTNPLVVASGEIIGRHFEGNPGQKWTAREILRWEATHGRRWEGRNDRRWLRSR